MDFEGCSYGLNTSLKFREALYHVFAGDNQSGTLFHAAADDNTHHAYLSK